jgi:hypothetical protein
MPDLDFSAPSYAAIAHDSWKQARPKREPAAKSEENPSHHARGSTSSQPATKSAAKPSRADRLYRKSAKR